MPDQLSTELASLKIARDEGPPPRGVLKVLFALVLIAAAGVAAYLFGLPYLEARVFKLEVSFTEIATVSPAQQAVELTATGYVVADTRSTVAPKVAGKVSRVMVKQGDQVKAGDVLFELDPRDQRAAAAAAATRVSAAQARAERARADLAEAELKAKREQALVARGVAPAEQAENLSARVISLTRAVKAAEAQVRVARAEAHASHVNLRSYQVRAPISGTVLNRPPAAGEVVGFQPGGVDEALGGVKLADFSTLVVEADVSEARLHLVKLGGPAEIVLDAFPQRRLRGKALALLPRVNRAKATVTVRVGFTDEPQGVLPEMAARVSFLSAELDAESMKQPPKTIVPGSAVTERAGAMVVFVEEDGRARMRSIEVGPAFGSGFELSRGPGPGARVIKHPPSGLTDGQRIKERTEE